jgi:hypothetical protein
MNPSAKGSSLLDCIDVDIGVGSSYHRRFAIFCYSYCRPVVPLEFEIPTRSHPLR